MANHKIKPPDNVIFPDRAVARRIFRHVLEGPIAKQPLVYASLMELFEYLDAEGIHEAIFNGEGYSYIVNWSRNTVKEGT